MLAFIMAHQAICSGVVVALLDLGFALKADWQSNGLLHAIYVFAKSKIS